MIDWRSIAVDAVFEAANSHDPEAIPVYQIPGRRWPWQLWKPKWETVTGVSRAQLERAHDA